MRITGVERAALIVGICGALLVIGFFATPLISGNLHDPRFERSIGLLYLCPVPWLLWHGIKRNRFGYITLTMLRYRRCPHCGYDLRALPNQPEDGATICPECGCAWQLADPAATNEKDTGRAQR